jgi:two-component system, OmpR family, phosphate regulon response regulator OmpR
VFRLRKLLGLSPCGRQYIQTRYRDGYVFCPDDAFMNLAGADSSGNQVMECDLESSALLSA